MQLKVRAWDVKEKRYVRVDTLDFHPSGGHINTIKVDGKPESWAFQNNYILELWTGLMDKNQRKIYDGDILSGPEWLGGKLGGVRTGNVCWSRTEEYEAYSHKQHFEWMVGADSLADVYHASTVVGNIHENPDLLRGSDDSKTDA